MVGDREKILAAGFHGYISKPITAEEFVPLIESYLPSALRVGPRAD
jgi:CheY-like chemotaxis protein